MKQDKYTTRLRDKDLMALKKLIGKHVDFVRYDKISPESTSLFKYPIHTVEVLFFTEDGITEIYNRGEDREVFWREKFDGEWSIDVLPYVDNDHDISKYKTMPFGSVITDIKIVRKVYFNNYQSKFRIYDNENILIIYFENGRSIVLDCWSDDGFNIFLYDSYDFWEKHQTTSLDRWINNKEEVNGASVTIMSLDRKQRKVIYSKMDRIQESINTKNPQKDGKLHPKYRDL
jgi:hypothetical protein